MTLDPYLAFVGFYNDWSAQMEGDVDFYVRRAREAAPGPIVELGVGTGRIAIPIAQAGIDVLGVDVSEPMMTEGRRRADAAGVGDGIRFVPGDMRDFVSDPPVSLVTIPFRSFLHLTTTEDQLRTLESIRESLVRDGRIVLNVFIPDPHVISAQNGRRNFLSEFIDEKGRRCELYSLPVYETATQRIHMQAICEAYDGDRHVESAEAALELRMVYRFEMEHLLVRAGFEVEALYGWFDERPVTEESREMIWVARKT